MTFFSAFVEELEKIALVQEDGAVRTDRNAPVRRLRPGKKKPKDYEYYDSSLHPSELIENVPSPMTGRGRDDRG